MKMLRETDVVSVWINYTVDRIFYWEMNRVKVIYPGRPANNGGCDLNDAVFSLNDRIITGNVEVHTRASHWYSHGHYDDARYNDVALHVVILDDINSTTITQNGKLIPLIDIGMLVDRVYSETGAKNSNIPVKSFGCAAIKAFSHTFLLQDNLSIIGKYRFYERASFFYEMFGREIPEQVMYKSIARCLGYEKNTLPFENLTDHLRIDLLKNYISQPESWLMAVILGTAGMLPSQTGKAAINTSIFSVDEIREIERYWRQNRFKQLLTSSDWHFFRIRPANHPVRRLIALGELVYRYAERGIVNSMIDTLLNEPCNKVVGRGKTLLKTNESKDGWLAGIKVTMLGDNKLGEIIVNAILPFLYAYGIYTGNKELGNKASKVYEKFPGLADNHLLVYMKRILLLENNDRLNSMEQQGLIHIFKNFCRYKDCKHCPLITLVVLNREQHPDRNSYYCSGGS
jgi:hypothetical protein